MSGLIIVGVVPSVDRPLRCETCEQRWPVDQRGVWERHVIACAARAEEMLLLESPRNRLGIFGGETVIPDLEHWVKMHRVELIEGRKRL